jgi:hypothetical protein
MMAGGGRERVAFRAKAAAVDITSARLEKLRSCQAVKAFSPLLRY